MKRPLAEVAGLFFRLGCTAFGGPAAHVALMEDEVVRRRAWLRREEFLDLVAATNLLPGPNSTELAIHLGKLRAGWPGLLVAGACFIGPAALFTGVLAWAYVRYGALPAAGALLYGIKPAILAIVVHALARLARSGAASIAKASIAAAALGAVAFGAHELAVLGGAALAGVVLIGPRAPRAPREAGPRAAIFPMAAAPASLGVAGVASVSGAAGVAGVASVSGATAGGLFLVFAKIGALLFGSGYVLLAFLRAEFVVRLGWLTEGQLLDAIAAGQVTPGPVFSTATFVGYVLRGPAGAAAATAGIFVPAFMLVALAAPLVSRLRASRAASAALDGVVAASLGLMALVTVQLGHAALVDPVTVLVALAAGVLLARTRVNTIWLVLAGAAVGHARGLLTGGA